METESAAYESSIWSQDEQTANMTYVRVQQSNKVKRQRQSLTYVYFGLYLLLHLFTNYAFRISCHIEDYYHQWSGHHAGFLTNE